MNANHTAWNGKIRPLKLLKRSESHSANWTRRPDKKLKNTAAGFGYHKVKSERRVEQKQRKRETRFGLRHCRFSRSCKKAGKFSRENRTASNELPGEVHGRVGIFWRMSIYTGRDDWHSIESEESICPGEPPGP